MTKSLGDLGRRLRGSRNEWALLLLLGLVAITLATVFPANHTFDATATSWRERDWNLWWHASQLYGRDPGELSDAELQDVKDWCRVLALTHKYQKTGLHSLTDDECQFVVDVLDHLAPALEAYYYGTASVQGLPVYEACCRRLAGEDSVAAGSGGGEEERLPAFADHPSQHVIFEDRQAGGVPLPECQFSGRF